MYDLSFIWPDYISTVVLNARLNNVTHNSVGDHRGISFDVQKHFLLQDSAVVDCLVFTVNSRLLRPRGALTKAVSNSQVSTYQQMTGGKVSVD